MDHEEFYRLVEALKDDAYFDSTIETALKILNTEYVWKLYSDEYLNQAKEILEKAKSPIDDAASYGKTCFSAGMAVAHFILETEATTSRQNLTRTIFTLEDNFRDHIKKHSKGGKNSPWKAHEALIIEHLEKYKIREFTSQEQCCQSISDKTSLTLKQSTFSEWWKKFRNGDPIFQ